MWDKEKPIVSVIMLNPCQADNIITDTTTYLVVNNVAKLEEFGGVDILNLYSKLATKLKFREESDDELNDTENDAFIVKSVMESSKTILAWGKISENNNRVDERAEDVINLLEKHHDKLYVISDGERTGLHPLTPCIRNKWILEKFNVER